MNADWDGSEADRRLITRAIREDWGITEEKWKSILARQVEIASGSDPDATPKDSVAAFKVLLMARQQCDKNAGGGGKGRQTTVNIGTMVNADSGATTGIALLERFRAIGVLGGPDGGAGGAIIATD